MSDPIDLDAYRQRIGYGGAFRPDLETLRALMNAHVCSVPFENLDVLMGKPILLDAVSLQDKIVNRRRGGYCFEQNGFLLEVLQQIGFEVTPLAARVRIGVPEDVITPLTHLFLQVKIDGVLWLADVGVGSMSLTTPILFDLDVVQDTPHDQRRIVAKNGRFAHQIFGSEGWSDVYQFTKESMPLIDREVGSWWTSTSPKGMFKQNLVVARAESDGSRFAIFNDRFIHRKGPDVLSETEINSAEDLREVLEGLFGLEVGEEESLEACFVAGNA